VHGALDGQVLTREELVGEVLGRTGDDGSRVTFTRPDTYLDDWPGLPDAAEAARIVIPSRRAGRSSAGRVAGSRPL
jgi:hypothetical protein